MDALLAREPRNLCPGHREPLTWGVEAACLAMRRTLRRRGLAAPWLTPPDDLDCSVPLRAPRL